MASGTNRNNINASAIKALADSRLSKSRINNRLVKKGNDNYWIQRAIKPLANAGYTTYCDESVSQNRMAMSMLSALGCVALKNENIYNANYSLIKTQGSKETLSNPDLLDNNITQLRNAPLSLEKSHPNTRDPIYVLDDGLTQVEKDRRLKIMESGKISQAGLPNVSKVASDVSALNLQGVPEIKLNYFI